MRDFHNRILGVCLFSFILLAPASPWGQTTVSEDEMLDQLLFGDKLPALDMEPEQPEATDSTTSELKAVIGEYLVGLPRWEKDFGARLDLGWADNVLLSPFEKDASGFLKTSIDAFLHRPKDKDGFQTYLYAFGEFTAYSDIKGMKNSSLFMIQDELGWMGSNQNEIGFQLKYTYYDQVYDASFNEFDKASSKVQANQFEIRPFLRAPATENIDVGAEAAVIRVLYRDPSEDNFEAQTRFFLNKRYGLGSKLEVELTGARREYDNRELRDSSGLPMRGTLKRWSLGGGVNWTHNLGARNTWQIKVNGDFKGIMDDGPGYYDYNLIRGNLSLARRGLKWKTGLGLGLSKYKYKAQLGDDGHSALFRSSIETSLSLERAFGRNWTGFLEWRREQDFSNARGYEYNANTISVGGDRSL